MSSKKRWPGRVYLGRDENGKQQFEWLGRFDTRRERDAAVAKRKLEVAGGLPSQLPACDEYVDRYLAHYERVNKVSSASTQRQRLARFRKDFAGRALDIPRHEARDWVMGDGRWSNNGPRTRSDVEPVVTLYNFAIDEDDLSLDRNPFRGLSPKAGRGRADAPPPTEEEFQALLDACAVHGPYAPMMRAMANFASFTLMRPSELYALEWGDIDLSRMRLRKSRRVYRGTTDVPKTGEKLIPLPPPARDAIIGLPRVGHLVFRSKSDTQLSSSTWSAYWRLVRARAGLDFDFYHATKHYGVHYLWTKLGLSERAIAAQAGWSTAAVRDLLGVYGHGDVGALEEVDRAFAENDNVVPLRGVTQT